MVNIRLWQAVPDFGGLLADYLWCDEDERTIPKATAMPSSVEAQHRPVQEMLMTGRSAQLLLITGMKEARLIDRPPMDARRYVTRQFFFFFFLIYETISQSQ